jgi:hypothetical protein
MCVSEIDFFFRGVKFKMKTEESISAKEEIGSILSAAPHRCPGL